MHVDKAPARVLAPSTDALAAARQVFGLDPRPAWRAVEAFRAVWALHPSNAASG